MNADMIENNSNRDEEWARGKGQCVTHPYLITHYPLPITHYPSLITNYIGAPLKGVLKRMYRRLLVGVVFLR